MSSNKPHSGTRAVAALIEELGGAKAVSTKTGHKAGTVRKWKCVNALPRSAWPDLQKAFPQISLDRLLDVESGR